MVKNAISLLIAGAAIFAAWKFLSPSDERRILKVFDRASELLSKSGEEPMFTSTAKARELAAFVAPGARLIIDERDMDVTIGGEPLVRQIVLARSQTQFIKIAFEGISVVFSDDGTAQVAADVLFKGTSDIMGFSGRDTRELLATMKRDAASGEWLFASIRLKPIVLKQNP